MLAFQPKIFFYQPNMLAFQPKFVYISQTRSLFSQNLFLSAKLHFFQPKFIFISQTPLFSANTASFQK